MLYSISKVAKKLGMDYKTAWARARSKYARERWGVVYIELPDGIKKPYVPENKLYLWERKKRFSKLSKEELEQYGKINKR